MHFYLNWSKERIAEMDATLASIETKANEVRADARDKADKYIADLRSKRDAFLHTVEKQTEAGETLWGRTKTQLEQEWAGFEDVFSKYIETFGKQVEQQQATYQCLVAAQMKAWREAVDRVQDAAGGFVAERRTDIDATVMRMKAEAAAAEDKLQQLTRAGTKSWSALSAALAETRAAFDRANEKIRDTLN